MDTRLIWGLAVIGVAITGALAMQTRSEHERVDELLQEARTLFEKEADVRGAAALIDEAIGLDPQRRLLYQRKGEVLTAGHFDAEALTALEQALELDRDDWETHRLLMSVWARLDRCDDAIDAVNSYLERHPSHAKAYYARGFCHYKDRRWEDALADVTRACDLGHQPGCDMAESYGKPASVISVERNAVPR